MDDTPFAFVARVPRPLLWAAIGHLLLGVACLFALGFTAPNVMGVHPALKPLRFAVSIAVFLGTMGIVLPSLSVEATTREALAWVFASTMTMEMMPIVVQSLRGTTSHFNVRGPLDAAMWSVMIFAIVVATSGMASVALLALLRPMVGADGRALPTLAATAWRAGLLLLLLSPVSGFAMGGRRRHSVGGEDGGAGLPIVNWSVQHGDLRVAHFLALHGLQLLPLLAWLLLRVAIAPWARSATLALAAAAMVGLCLATLAQALAGRPLLRR